MRSPKVYRAWQTRAGRWLVSVNGERVWGCRASGLVSMEEQAEDFHGRGLCALAVAYTILLEAGCSQEETLDRGRRFVAMYLADGRKELLLSARELLCWLKAEREGDAECAGR